MGGGGKGRGGGHDALFVLIRHVASNATLGLGREGESREERKRWSGGKEKGGREERRRERGKEKGEGREGRKGESGGRGKGGRGRKEEKEAEPGHH